MEAIIAVFMNLLILAGASNNLSVETDTSVKKERDTHTRVQENNTGKELKSIMFQTPLSDYSRSKIEVWKDPEPEPQPILN